MDDNHSSNLSAIIVMIIGAFFYITSCTDHHDELKEQKEELTQSYECIIDDMKHDHQNELNELEDEIYNLKEEITELDIKLEKADTTIDNIADTVYKVGNSNIKIDNILDYLNDYYFN